MTVRATGVYLAAVTVCGLGAFTASAVFWRNIHLAEFAFLLVTAAATSRMQVRLPGVEGTVSVSFLFILLGAVELTPAQTVLIAAAATLSHSLWKPQDRPAPEQVVFDLSCAACSAWAYHLAFATLAAHDLAALRSLALLPVLGAAAVYFLLNTALVSGKTALAERKSFLRTWQDGFVSTAPQYLIGALLALILDRLYSTFGWEIFLLVMPVLFLTHYSHRLYLGRVELEKKHGIEMAELQLRTLKGLALAIEARDSSTHNHVRRVRRLALIIAAEIPVTGDERQAMEAGAILHDIGKLAIPEHILSKPGKLTEEEFAKMKTHCVVGAEILESIGFPYPVVPIVRHHHEKWDGSGYPDGLRGEQIPMGARILSVVDCFDALTSHRLYRRAIKPEDAVAFIRAEAGRSFDPKIVDLFEKHAPFFHSLEEERPEIDNLVEAPLTAGFISTIAASRQEFQRLLDVTTELGSSLRTEEIFALLSQRLGTMAPYDCMAIFVLQQSALAPLFCEGVDAELMGSQPIPIGEGLSGWVAQTGSPLVSGDPAIEPAYRAKALADDRLRSAISVPLQCPGGLIGALTLYNRTPDFYTADHLRVLLSVSAKAGLAIGNALRFDEARKNATTDELTGLPNARSLYAELEREISFCRRSGSTLSVLVLDLDGFKQVNDRFGHLGGNRLLAHVAKGLTACCREHDYCARVGGDEFVMMLRDAGPADLDRRLKQLCDSVVNAGIELLGERVISLSVGSAFYPSDAESAEGLVAHADSRMYEMKRAGKRGRATVEPESLSAFSDMARPYH